MSLDALLTQICTIKRPTAGQTDRYNNTKFVDFVVASDVICRQVVTRVRTFDPTKAEHGWAQVDQVLLPAGTDVQPLDKLYIDDGATPRTVKNLLPRRARAIHHITVELEALNG